MGGEQSRISVGLTRQEMDEIFELARRCNTSVSALGQLAVKQLLMLAKNGTIPMLPPASAMNDEGPVSSMELEMKGSLVSIDAWHEESDAKRAALQATLNFKEAQAELNRLADLTAPDPSTG